MKEKEFEKISELLPAAFLRLYAKVKDRRVREKMEYFMKENGWKDRK